MAMEKVPMTIEGFKKLEEELHRLKSEERPRIIQQISDAREHGDLSENAEYHAAKEAQGLNEARVAEIEDKLSRAEVIDITKLSGEHRQVRRHRHARGRGFRREGQIQDRRRARKPTCATARSRSSSPIARALIGKSKGDSAEVTTPKGSRSYEILKLEFK